jgi:signal transduction histidine kinase
MSRTPAVPAIPPDAPGLGEPTRPVVWVVDADPRYAEQARHHLARDHDVEVLADGAAVLARLGQGHGPEALLLASRLPGMGGLEVLRALRPEWDRLRLPVLMVTSQGRRQDVVAGFRAGANDYLIKPYDPFEMLARVDALVGLRRLGERRLRARLDEAQAQARAAAEAMSRSKDEWIAMVSHELRSPLNAMLGWTRMLRSGQLPAEKRERALEAIERNALNQTQLIEDLLDVSRMVSGQLRLGLQPLALGAVARAALDAVRPAAEARGVSLGASIDDEVGDVLGDPDRLRQVVDNLLGNAVKFVDVGGAVSLTLRGSEGGAELAVSDDGRGIDPAFAPYLFDRFKQQEGGIDRGHGGLGLGLSIVRHVVELHGGAVRAQSPGVGRGATFTVTLPVVSGEAAEPRRASAPALRPTPDFAHPPELRGLRVLVVDDEPDAREVVVSVLEQCGAAVTSAASAREARELIAGAAPEVLVSDIGMPGETGYDLIRGLRAGDGAAARVPAVALTAYARVEDRARALAAGFDAHAAKPIEPGELARVIAPLAGRA